MPAWDRTGLTTPHPTPARLKVWQRPSSESVFVPGTDRRVITDLTDLPGGEEQYELWVRLFDVEGKEVWQKSVPVLFEDHNRNVGVRLFRLTIGRNPARDESTVQVPMILKDVRTMEVTAVPVGGAPSMRVFVRLPDWW